MQSCVKKNTEKSKEDERYEICACAVNIIFLLFSV